MMILSSETTFVQAYERLQEIQKTLMTQDILDVDYLVQLQDEAKELHAFLTSRLHTSQNDVEKTQYSTI